MVPFVGKVAEPRYTSLPAPELVPFSTSAVVIVLVTPLKIEKLVEVAILSVLETVSADVCRVIVPVEEAVRLLRVAPPPVIEAEELVITIVEAPGVIVPPTKLKFPATVCVAPANVTVPEAVRLRSVWAFEVRVPVPPIMSVFPAEAVRVQFVRSTFPDTLQLPEPVMRVFPVPAEQVRLPVTSTAGLLVSPVRVTSPDPDSATSSPAESVWVPALIVTVRPAVAPELLISRRPPYVRFDIVWLFEVASKRRMEEMVPPVGKAVPDRYVNLPAPEIVPLKDKLLLAVTVMPLARERVSPDATVSVPPTNASVV